MRADRLISLIMLLETKGPLTAKELSEELNVTQRTIYRDIDSLCYAGVPVYGVSGRDGGYNLVKGYKSYLNVLNGKEILALLSLNIPDHLSDIALGTELKTAILKLKNSYKQVFNNNNNNDDIRSRLYVDSSGWGDSNNSSTHINTLYNAVQNNIKVHITYKLPPYPQNSLQKVINPYGLVTKDNYWYLIYLDKEKIRVIKVTNILDIKEINEGFEYPQGFNLEKFWKAWCKQVNKDRSTFRVTVLVPSYMKSSISMYMKKGIVPFTPIPIDYDKEEWCEIELLFDSFEDARNRLLSFGKAVKVVKPDSLRYSIVDFAKEVISIYDSSK